MKGLLKKMVSFTTAAAMLAGAVVLPEGRARAVTPEETLRQELAGLIAGQDDEDACSGSKSCNDKRLAFNRLTLSQQWMEIVNAFQFVEAHPEGFSSDFVQSVSNYLGLVDGLKTQLSKLGYVNAGPTSAGTTILATEAGPSLNGSPLRSSLMKLALRDAVTQTSQATQVSPGSAFRKNPFVFSDISDGPPGRREDLEVVGGVDKDRETETPPPDSSNSGSSGNSGAPSGGGSSSDGGVGVTDVVVGAAVVATVIGAAAGALVVTAAAATIGVIAGLIGVFKDESPDQIEVSPELRASLEPMVQSLLQHPQGGVKGGQVDPIALKDTQTTQSPDAATKSIVSAQQKAQLLNQAKFGSGFAAPISSRNGGGGIPTEIGGKVGSPIFTNSGAPASTGCAAGRVCR